MVKSISKKGNKIDPKLEKLSDFKNNLSKLLNQNEIDEILEIVHLFPVKWKIDSKHQDKNLVRLVNKYSPIENKAEIWDILYNISKLQRKKNVDKEIANSSYYLERFVKYEFSKQAEFDVWTKLIAKYKALLKNETTKKLIRYFEIVKKIVQNSFELEEVQLQCLKAFLEILANPDEYMDQITKNTSISKESLKSLYEGYHKKLMKIMKEQHKTGISSNLINQVFLNKQPCQNYALNQIENFSQKNQNNNESYEDQTKENEDIFDEDLEKIKNVEVVNLEKITMNEKVVNFEDYNEEENMDSNEQNDEKQFVHTNEVHKNEKYQNIPVFTTLMDEKSTESREGYSGSDDSVSKFVIFKYQYANTCN